MDLAKLWEMIKAIIKGGGAEFVAFLVMAFIFNGLNFVDNTTISSFLYWLLILAFIDLFVRLVSKIIYRELYKGLKFVNDRLTYQERREEIEAEHKYNGLTIKDLSKQSLMDMKTLLQEKLVKTPEEKEIKKIEDEIAKLDKEIAKY